MMPSRRNDDAGIEADPYYNELLRHLETFCSPTTIVAVPGLVRNIVDSQMSKLADAVLDQMMDDGVINHVEVTTQRPPHGSCCTCQECGFHHDDCCCQDNAIIASVMKAFGE